jgi:hypothetical protein
MLFMLCHGGDVIAALVAHMNTALSLHEIKRDLYF